MLGITMALGASASWALASFVTVRPLKTMSVLRFALFRFTCVAVTFAALSVGIGGFSTLTSESILVLVLSGLIGIGVGETLLYLAIKESGPQIGLFMFSLNIPLTFVAACVFGLREFNLLSSVGAVLVLAGVVLGIKARKTGNGAAPTRMLTSLGLASGIGAAVAQSVGLFLTKTAFDADVSVVGVTAIRAMSAMFLVAALVMIFERNERVDRPRGRTLGDVLLSAALSSGLGLFLANTSLKYGSPTVAAACLSLAPMFVAVIQTVASRKAPSMDLLAGCTLFASGLFLLS